ncbi:hypothetical protein B0T17DRAFT_43466 [Bombardia bombarda]|uniref:Zn(2)-C6 fungal-type domain-containing protein n=1 Tax=Bombardia bombarda TaxID=252184 RepID=A0AA39XKU1_9PEZI|nr:hypothetical protein B0T17DRAFT_43466 [Bombardia bombarda]
MLRPKMAEPLKRTFHGCLTCRKRKVRCRGGDPCQNCSRMNITCHSSFDTNLRIRVSTPTGQKDVETKPKPARDAGSKSQFQSQQPSPLSPSIIHFDNENHNKPFNSFQSQLVQYPLPQPLPTFISEPPNIPHLSPLSSHGPPTGAGTGTGASGLDTLQYPAIWGYDFSAIDPDLEHDYNNVVLGGGAPPLSLPPLTYDSWKPSPPISRRSYTISDSDGSVSPRSQYRGGTKEWVPRRRKRTKTAPVTTASLKTQAATGRGNGSGSTEGRARTCDGVDAHSPPLQTYSPQDDPIAKYVSKFSFDKFVLNFVQRCAPQCPMRLAVLAWMGKQSTDRSLPDPIATAWYSQASEHVFRMMTIPDPTVIQGRVRPVTNIGEIIICASFFLNRYDLLDGNLASVDHRLERISRWLADHPGHLNLSAFASKLALWACYLQIRIGIFGSTPPRFTSLLDVLTERADYHHIVERSHSFQLDMFGDEYPPEQLAEDVDRIPVSVRLHETFCLLASMMHYRSLLRSQNSAGHDASGWKDLIAAERATIDRDFHREAAEFEMAVVTIPSASILRCGPMAAAASSSSSNTGGFCLPPLVTPRQHNSDSNNNNNNNSHMLSLPLLPSPSPSMSSSPSSSSSPFPSFPSSIPSFPRGAAAVTDPPLSRVSLDWLTAYASFLTARILWSRLMQQQPPNNNNNSSSSSSSSSVRRRTDAASAAAVESILQIALLLRRSHAHEQYAQALHGVSSAMLWPLPLFVAGIETVDEVRADWLRLLIAGGDNGGTGGGGGGGAGGYGGRSGVMLAVMEEVRKRQNEVGGRVDVGAVLGERGVVRVGFLRFDDGDDEMEGNFCMVRNFSCRSIQYVFVCVVRYHMRCCS